MKKCRSCNKITETKRRCRECGSPLCFSCATTKLICGECRVIQEEKEMVEDYYKDKFLDKYSKPLSCIKSKITGTGLNLFILSLLIFILMAGSVSAYSKYDVVKNHVLIESDITHGISQYTVCNPSPDPYVVSGNNGKKLSVTFDVALGELKSYKYYIYKNVNHPYTVNDYGSVEKSYVCTENFNYTTNPNYAVCYVNDANGTLVLFEHSFTHSNITQKTIYWDETEKTGEHLEQNYFYDWLQFNPVGKTMQANTCYDIRIRADFKANSVIDNVITASDGTYDYEYPEWAWWNTTWNFKYLITTIAAPEYPNTPFKVNLNGSDITLADCSPADMRVVNSSEDGVFAFNYSSSESNATNLVFYVNESAQNNLSWYLYCNASGVTSASVSLPVLGLSSGLYAYYRMDGTGDAVDVSGNSNDATETGTVAEQTGLSLNDTKARGVHSTANNFNRTTTDLAKTNNITGGGWVQLQADSGEQYKNIIAIRTSASAALLQVYLDTTTNTVAAYSGCAVSQAITPAAGAWYHIVATYDTTGNNLSIYLNGTKGTSCSDSGTDVSENYGIGAFPNPVISQPADQLYIDDLAIWDGRALSSDDVSVWFSSVSAFPFYSSPFLSVGVRIGTASQTTLSSGMFNASYVNVSNVPVRTAFRFWANYSYNDNSTPVISNAYCNFTAINITDPNSVSGSNVSVCVSGCDTTNQSQVFTGLDTVGYIRDQYEISLCSQGVPKKDYYIGTNCSSENYQLDKNTISLCTAGTQTIRIRSSNCSGESSVNLSVWSYAASSTNALVVVNGSMSLDRLHNHTNNMTYNASSGFYQTSLHHYDTVGNKNVYFNCYGLDGNAENKSSSNIFNSAAVSPVVVIDSIWWWQLSNPVLFSTGIDAKLPVQNFLNISSSCNGFNLDTVIHYLNYSANGTNIYTHMVTSGFSHTTNLSKSNFSASTNYISGALGYTFQEICNNTLGNSTTVSKTFLATNAQPTISWVNSTPLAISSIPTTLNVSCLDNETEATTKFYYVNGSLNISSTNSGVVFNQSESSYDYVASCSDSYRNSSNTSALVVTYSTACLLQVFGISANVRYRNNVVNLSANCSNSISLSTCQYRINKYAPETFVCSGQNVTMELGENSFVINVTTVSSISTTSSIRVFAKRLNDAGLAGYMVIAVLLLAVLAFGYLYYTQMRMGALALILAGGIVILGMSLLSFSLLAGGFIIIAGFIIAFYEVLF